MLKGVCLFQGIVLVLPRRGFSKIKQVERFMPKEVKKVEKVPFYPKQHPIGLDSDDKSIIKLERKRRNLTPARDVPYEAYLAPQDKIELPANPKGIDVSVLGAPNAGKSTLVNKLIGKFVTCVSNKANTTGEVYLGIHTDVDKDTQLVLHDTPGIIKRYKGTEHFLSKGWETIEQCDRVLFVVDALKRVDESLRAALNRLKSIKYDPAYVKFHYSAYDLQKSSEKSEEEYQASQTGETPITIRVPTILVLNKMDICNNKRRLREITMELSELYNFDKVFHVSADSGFGLQELKEYLISQAEPRAWRFAHTQSTDRSPIDLIEDMIRSFVFERYFYELPFLTGVKIIEYVPRSDGSLKLRCQLDVEGDHQRNILIGHQGRHIKYLIKHSEMMIMQHFGIPVELSFHVMVSKDKYYVANQRTDIVSPPGLGTDEAVKELENLKARRKQSYLPHDRMAIAPNPDDQKTPRMKTV